MPERIQRRRVKGWRMPEGARFVGRPTKYGNPFRVEHLGTQQTHAGEREWWDVVHIVTGVRHATRLTSKREATAVAVDLYALHAGPMGSGELSHEDIEELRGIDLACYCPPEDAAGPWPCHADVLLEWANS